MWECAEGGGVRLVFCGGFAHALGCKWSEVTVRWQRELTLAGHTEMVLAVAFSADGKRIVSGSLDCLVKIWDTETGALVSSCVVLR